MPFGSFNLPPVSDSGPAFSAAGYAALVSAARVSGVAGDLCYDETLGEYWKIIKPGATAFLIPTWAAAEGAAVVSNATGDAWCDFASDDLTDIVNRGWAQSSPGNGTLTIAGGKLTINGGTDGGGVDQAEINFAPAVSQPQKNLFIFQMGAVFGDYDSNTALPRFQWNLGLKKQLRCSATDGSGAFMAGVGGIIGNPTNTDVNQRGSLALDGVDHWVMVFIDHSDSDSQVIFRRLDLAPQGGIRIQQGLMSSTSTTQYYAQWAAVQWPNSGGALANGYDLSSVIWVGW